MKFTVLTSLVAAVSAVYVSNADIYQELLKTMKVLERYVEVSGRGWNDPSTTPRAQFDALLPYLDSFQDKLQHYSLSYFDSEFNDKFKEFQSLFTKIGKNYDTYGGELGGFEMVWYMSSNLWIKYHDIMFSFAHIASCQDIGSQYSAYSSVESCWTAISWHWNYRGYSSEYKHYDALPTTNCDTYIPYPMPTSSDQAVTTQAPTPSKDTYSTYTGAQSTYRCRVVQ